jgi:glycine/D-amino acid oxidase-like deaminating enzyme
MPLPMKLLDTDRALSRNSYYAATAARGPGHAPLEGELSCDVAVVGGGLAGLSAALDLRQRGFDVVLVEARQLGWGASGRNGGQAIHGLACDQDTIESQLGLDASRRIWAMSIEALDLLRARIAEHHIACDWQRRLAGPGHVGPQGRAAVEAGPTAWPGSTATRSSASRRPTSGAGSPARATTAACTTRAPATCTR